MGSLCDCQTRVACTCQQDGVMRPRGSLPHGSSSETIVGPTSLPVSLHLVQNLFYFVQFGQFAAPVPCQPEKHRRHDEQRDLNNGATLSYSPLGGRASRILAISVEQRRRLALARYQLQDGICGSIRQSRWQHRPKTPGGPAFPLLRWETARNV